MKSYPSEKYSYIDKETGARVTRLTGAYSNSNHLYFTNNCFYDGGRSIVFASERSGTPNLYSLELESGKIEQLTDLPQKKYPGSNGLHLTFVHPEAEKAVFWDGAVLYCLDLKTREQREIYRLPAGFNKHIVSIGAEGKYAYTSKIEDVRDRRRDATLQGTYDCHPYSEILKIALDGSGAEVVFSENNFIAHVNASPKDENKLTFCHEGFWEQVDHRLWALDLKTGKAEKIHPCKKGEAIGHEYWFADGNRIGYHGLTDCNRVGPTDEQLLGTPLLGAVNFDGSCDKSYDFPYNMGHIFSLDERLIVGDGDRRGRYLRLWELSDGGYGEPRALCLHASSFKNQLTHVHPRITPDGKGVLYTSDESGYNQLYLAEIPEDISTLPLLKTLSNC